MTTPSNRVEDRVRAVLDQTSRLRIGGGVVGVMVEGHETVVPFGIANLNTGQPFTADTGFLFGSVTKLLTTTAVLSLVDKGDVDLDEPVRRYVPEFALRDADAAAAITVRMLLNHTNGIDADLLRPTAVRGRDAARSYTEHLPHRGVVFEPGSGIHYSNPGMVLAARVVEERTGLPFERAMPREIFGPVGMDCATLLQTQALLRRTAIGAFETSTGQGLRATSLFSLAESGAGAGATLVGTVADIFAFARLQLTKGLTPDGRRVLSTELVEAMQTPTYDIGLRHAPQIGLGWWLLSIAGTPIRWHTGGSPGARSLLSLIPDCNAAVVSYASGPDAGQLHDSLHLAVIEEVTGRPAEPPFEPDPADIAEGLAGDYLTFQQRAVVEVRGDELVITEHFEPYDDEHWENHVGYNGAATPSPPRRYASLTPRNFLQVGVDPRTLAGPFARWSLITALPPGPGRRAGLWSRMRFAPKAG